MGRTPEEPLPIEDEYRRLLRIAVKAAGGQVAVSKIADLDQGTISRTLADGSRATYTTLAKLSRALPSVPAPVVAIRDADHALWCHLGALVAEHDPEQFAFLLRQLRRDAEALGWKPEPPKPPVSPTPDAVSRLKSVITNPLPKRARKGDRGG